MSRVVMRDGVAADKATQLELPGGPRVIGLAIVGLVLTAIFFGGFIAWSATAPLSSAALAIGRVKIDGGRQLVAAPEAGIARELLVRDGDLVAAGQLLMRLHDPQAAETVEALGAILDAQRALRARLEAEATGADGVVFPSTLTQRRLTPRVGEILTGQESVFQQRRHALMTQLAAHRQRLQEAQAELRSAVPAAEAIRQQLRQANDEIAALRETVRQGYRLRPRLQALQRQVATLEATRDQHQATIARAQQQIGEAELQAKLLVTTFERDAIGDLRDLELKIVENEARLQATSAQVQRDVLAPAAGTVRGMRQGLLGAALRRGDTLLEIGPAQERPMLEVAVTPQDAELVAIGLRADVRFTAFRQHVVPLLAGRVVAMSNSPSLDERTGQHFYRTQIEIDAAEMEKLAGLGIQVISGMPVEVLIRAADRTMLSYLTTPLRESFRRAFREQ
jgi:HlyD family type I secretion membrane fusion protein